MKKEKSVAEATPEKSNISSNQQLMNILKNCAENNTNFSTERFVDIPDYLNALEKIPMKISSKTKAKKISIEDAKIIDALIAVLMAMILKDESTKKSKKTKKK